MSDKHPNDHYGKYPKKSVIPRHLDQSSQMKYYQRLELKIDNLLVKISDLKDQHPYEDYQKFETPTRSPGYFGNPVRFFNLRHTGSYFICPKKYVED